MKEQTREALKEWDVTIEATTRRTLRIQSPTRSQAIEVAHEIFSNEKVLSEKDKEEYSEETVDVKEVE